MIDKRPAAIVRPAGVADVIVAVRFGREHGLPIAIRGGGHSVAGFGTCDGGLVIDLGPLKGARVDLMRQTVSAQAGLTWGELDRETQAFGLATTGGLVSTTGISGLTLGGGIGWLLRKHGLTIDNVLGADVITARGELVRASVNENPELFWALRGGGGNFGVVTAFDYQLHDVGPIVLGGGVIHTADRASDVLRFYRDWVRGVPDELTTLVAFFTAPPEPFVPRPLVGQPMLGVFLCYDGPMDTGQTVTAPLRAFAPPAIDLLGPIPYAALQKMFDGTAPRGIRSYWKTAYLDDLSDAVIETLLEHTARMDQLSPLCAVHIHQAGGAAARSVAGDSAFGGRDARFILNVPASWHSPNEDSRHIAWVRELYRAIVPLAGGGAYLNFLGGDDSERIRMAYGAEVFARLAAVKRQYDPDNVFRINQNIMPAA